MASNRRQALNGTGAHHAAPVSAQHGHFAGSFDIDDGSFKSRPRTLFAIAAGMFVIGGMIAIALYRLNTIETAVSELPAVIEKRIEQSEIAQEQTRKIACLQQQIANRNWTCPDAVAQAAPAVPDRPAKRTVTTAAKKPDPSPFGGMFNWSAEAGKK